MAVEDVAQGGWCVARPEGLPVIFVRHALPGERVLVVGRALLYPPDDDVAGAVAAAAALLP